MLGTKNKKLNEKLNKNNDKENKEITEENNINKHKNDLGNKNDEINNFLYSSICSLLFVLEFFFSFTEVIRILILLIISLSIDFNLVSLDLIIDFRDFTASSILSDYSIN